MRLLSWNVAGRQGAALAAQADEVIRAQADVVALQEITAKTFDAWERRLRAAGFSVLSTVHLLPQPYPGAIKRKNCNLLAAMGQVGPLPGLTWPNEEEESVAFPEKHPAARVALEEVALEVHNTHLPPGSSRGVIKPQAFDAICRRVDAPTQARQVLCGDFNSPRSESDDGVKPWGRSEAWRASERGVLEHARLRDVYRIGRAPGTEFAVSHRTRSGPKRYDHIYVDPLDWASTRCRYRTEWLDSRLSDHAAVEAELIVR